MKRKILSAFLAAGLVLGSSSSALTVAAEAMEKQDVSASSS